MRTYILVLGVLVVGLTFIGAVAMSNSKSTIITAPDATSVPKEIKGASASANSYTLTDVASHNSASSCWSAINGKVYDLTSLINRHPGGPGRILRICGTDGSSLFNGQHGGEPRPARELAESYIGDLTPQ